MLNAKAPVRVALVCQSSEQKKELLSVVCRHGWKCVFIYIGEDRRFLFLELRKHKFDLLLVWRLSCVGSSLEDLVRVLEKFSPALISHEEAFVSNASTLQTLRAIRKFQLFENRQRAHSGVQKARRQGRVLGRPRTVFFRQVGDLRQKGHSLSQIARHLQVTSSAVRKVWRTHSNFPFS